MVLNDVTYSTEFHKKYQLGPYQGDAYSNLHLIWISKNQCWPVTHSHLVCLEDIVNSWFSVTLYSIIYKNKYPMHNLQEEVRLVLETGRELIRNYETPAYKVLKMWPSLTISSILRDIEGKTSLYNTLKKDLRMY